MRAKVRKFGGKLFLLPTNSLNKVFLKNGAVVFANRDLVRNFVPDSRDFSNKRKYD